MKPRDIANPKHFLEFDVKTGRTTLIEDWRGSMNIPEHPELLWCDFCLRQTGFMTFYTHRGVCVGTHAKNVVFEQGYWGACAMCKPLFESRAWDVLAARVCTLNTADEVPPHHELVRIYSAISDARTVDPPREWSSGMKR